MLRRQRIGLLKWPIGKDHGAPAAGGRGQDQTLAPDAAKSILFESSSRKDLKPEIGAVFKFAR
ncbi:hypothetical protein CU100_04675 [Phyllobacterium endophyticum]|uniref:Uncharacterized protein n=1 Tax=Phyllobacterium endophyticum TaxID=1149773 RepID=A0A2P7B0Q7_9HYPH|nr:hypothetical protein CU100_04675 [Phyllobacterium endophyticum]